MVHQTSYWKVLTRRKPLSQESGEGDTKLNRVLGLYDLTALGVGSTLGAGVYVLAGQIAKDQAGPSVTISFAIAALASLLAGICYAEFGARVPKAGSAYVYSYVCVGEFAAFVIGWNLILEYMIGTASVCRGISLYLDTLINDTLKTTFVDISPMNVSFLGSYFDFFAFGLVVVFGVALAFGVETSAIANNFCTCLNLFILLFVIVAGAIKSNFANWSIDVNNVTNVPDDTQLGDGGFFPFGFTGTLKGAATCFFGFVGFDCIATTGEEVKNPRKNIPRSILLSLLVIFLCYCGVSTVLTLMVPYYLQDVNAPLPSAFKDVGWNFAMWIVAIGGLVGLLASLFGALFPLPRVMYSMAQDGLLFRFLGRIHPRYRVPVMGSVFAAVVTALIAGLFDLAQLVNLLSIGTLLAYSVVAISITILRYMDNSEALAAPETTAENGHANGNNNGYSNHNQTNGNGYNLSESSLLTAKGERTSFKSVVLQLFNFKRVQVPNDLSTRIVGSLITLFCLLSVGIGLIFMQAYDALINNQLWVLILLVILVVLTVLVLLCICLQPREALSRVFRVPLVPIVPAISIFINIYLMLQLDVMTWIRFGVWMAIGKYSTTIHSPSAPLTAVHKSIHLMHEFILELIALVACLICSSLLITETLLSLGIPMFIACWCMYDIKNPANRHPDRIEFEKLMKILVKPAAQPQEVSNDDLVLSGTSAAATIVMQQNERSVKSLDEIMHMNEVSDELMEVKHPNGQICYVEDSRSDKSQNSLSPKESTEPPNAADSNKSDTSEEEKSVIAMLDDVLQTEDDSINEGHLLPNYDRKISVDSELVPSVTRSTTVATVHSSSGTNSDNDLNEAIEDSITPKSMDSGIGNFGEKHRLASDLVDEILNSPKLWMALEEHRLKQLVKLPQDNPSETDTDAFLATDADKVLDVPNHSQSVEPIEDPLHSEKFRSKLSQLIIKPPEIKPAKEVVPLEVTNEVRPKLKHSKSEADIHQAVLRAIEGCNIDIDDNTNSSEVTTQKIPKPPKFDPVLYQTINSLGKLKERPSLDKLLKKDEISTPTMLPGVVEAESPTTEVPFKLKLEAILKRGPSHKSQLRPNVELRRPKSMEPLQVEQQPAKNQVLTKSQSNLSTTPANAIQEARRTLRSVKQKSVL